MSRKIAPEAVLLTLLLVMLAASILFAYVKMDAAISVWGARIICVMLAILLVIGVIYPAKRSIARAKAARENAARGNRDAS